MGRLEGRSGLPRTSASVCLADSRGGSGEAEEGEVLGDAGGLGVAPGGACSRTVTVVTFWLLGSGVGVGLGPSVCCSCSSRSGACSHCASLRAARPWLSSLEPLFRCPLHNLPAKVTASISWARSRRMAARISFRSSYSAALRSSTVSSSTSLIDSSCTARRARAARCSASCC